MKPLLLTLTLLLTFLVPTHAGPVTAVRLPNGGIQPQAVVDGAGELHLIYYSGDPSAGDVYYIHKPLSKNVAFSEPLRVNTEPGTAIATGTIRGAQLAVGKGGRIHVVWNGVAPKGEDGLSRQYLAYARLGIDGLTFERQRNLSLGTGDLDGGGSVAADAAGDVYAVWHVSAPGKDESQGVVCLARSLDAGRSFRPTRRINPAPTGQCGCCAMKAFADSRNGLYVLYRSAQANVNRDATLLFSEDKGLNFRARTLQKWPVNACPMSSFSLSEGAAGVVGAWETLGQVYFEPLLANGRAARAPVSAPGTGSRKYPFAMTNTYGETLLAWVEGAGWQRGGKLEWQVFGKDGRPTKEAGSVDGVPVWSLVSGVTRPEGTFVLFY